MTKEQILAEIAACHASPAHFTRSYFLIEDAEKRDWIRFELWPQQVSTLDTVHASKLSIILKSRQLGCTWLVLSYALWLLLFRPNSMVLLFSRRDDEAIDLLKHRLYGSLRRLPPWLQSQVLKFNDHELELANGSRAKAFPTTAGDSYSANLAIVDEADLIPDLDGLLGSVKPTVDSPAGKLVLLSRPDKSRPESPFKRIYAAARQKQNPWVPVFLPWSARPSRDSVWYEEVKRDVLARTGSLDELHEQYPSKDSEALAPRSLDKRIPPDWLTACFADCPSCGVDELYVPGLQIFSLPEEGRKYVIGADPAEGNPTSDDSALEVLDVDSGEEVAALAGKFEPTVFASYIDLVAMFFFKARILCERNNHGHAVIAWLRDNSHVGRICGTDGKPGWLSNSRGKALMYSAVADAARSQDFLLHSFATFQQLASIEGSSLRAPPGQHDDRADAFALACVAREKSPSASSVKTETYRVEPRPQRELFGAENRGSGWGAKSAKYLVRPRPPRELWGG